MPVPPRRVDAVNILLMLVSAAAAVAAPFHLFLFSYAVLGPLHYLTEMSWLQQRGFFVERPRARGIVLLFAAFAAAAMLYGYVSSELLKRPVPPVWEIGLFLFVFLAAAILQVTAHPVNAGAVLVLGGAAIALASQHPMYAIVAYLLITIVHVFVFTGCFILYGARKSGSGVGYLSFAVFLACAVAILLIPVGFVAPGGRVRIVYAAFEQLNMLLLRFAGRPAAIYDAPAVGVMRFIAYAYTYHYLNWFSKTSVIRWHAVSKRRAGAIAAIWLTGLAVYWADYQLGFALFYILSAAHVMLEFPLNHQTFAGLYRSMVPARVAAPATARRTARRG